jgi:hypothetical protein
MMKVPGLGVIDPRNTKSFYRQIFLLLIIGGGVLLLIPTWIQQFSQFAFILFVMAGSLITIGVAGLVYDYLRYDRLEYARKRNFIEHRFGEIDQQKGNNRPSSKMGASMEKFPRQVSGSSYSSELMELRAKIINETTAGGKRLDTSDIINNTAKFLENEARIAYLHQSKDFFRLRLEEEIDDLGGRGRVNLTIGAAFAVCGIIVLGIVSVYNSYGNYNDLLYRFAPRLTFVIFIESLAFFFLGLYRHSIFETKYFQNELTNLEARCIALENALLVGDPELIKAVCKSLAETERNFLLKKGETTIDMRLRESMENRDRRLTDEFRKMAETIAATFKGPAHQG